MKSLSIIIPAYNEEENISKIKSELVPELKKITKNYEIIVVNDESKDKTAEKTKQLMKKDKKIILVSYYPNGGMGYALKQGIKKATKELIIFLDCDMTFHPRDIKKLLERFEKGDVDFVAGMPNKETDAALWRVMFSKAVNIFYCLLIGKKINSITPIFRLYKTSQLKELDIESNKFEINVEILFKLIRKGKKVAEVPVKLGRREFGESKLNYFKEIKNHLRLVKKILIWKFKR